MGVSSILERFERELVRDRAADAYLFVGRSRLALRRTVEEAAGRLLGVRGRVGEHPDYALFDPEQLGVKGLRVEHVAERRDGVPSVEAALRFRPVAGDRRCLVLLDADFMGADAQAALLKTAEEPPPGTVLMLTAADLSPLLPALRSRCRTYRVPAPPPEEIERKAAAAGIEEPLWSILLQASGGPEAVLALEPVERESLAEAYASFQTWLERDPREGAWLAPPEGSGLAEQRLAGGLRLAAALGWMAALYPDSSADQALRLDRLGRLLSEAQGDLGRQISPAILFEDLAKNLLERP